MEAQDVGVLRFGWLPGEFNPSDLFIKTMMHRNTRRNLVYSIFSNTVQQICGIDNAWVNFNMGTSKCLPRTNNSLIKWFWGLYIYMY